MVANEIKAIEIKAIIFLSIALVVSIGCITFLLGSNTSDGREELLQQLVDSSSETRTALRENMSNLRTNYSKLEQENKEFGELLDKQEEIISAYEKSEQRRRALVTAAEKIESRSELEVDRIKEDIIGCTTSVEDYRGQLKDIGRE